MSSTFFKSLSARIPPLHTPGASKIIAIPKPHDFIHARHLPAHSRTTKILSSIAWQTEAQPKAANWSADLLTPVATISDQPRRCLMSLVRTALFRLGSRQEGV